MLFGNNFKKLSFLVVKIKSKIKNITLSEQFKNPIETL